MDGDIRTKFNAANTRTGIKMALLEIDQNIMINIDLIYKNKTQTYRIKIERDA